MYFIFVYIFSIYIYKPPESEMCARPTRGSHKHRHAHFYIHSLLMNQKSKMWIEKSIFIHGHQKKIPPLSRCLIEWCSSMSIFFIHYLHFHLFCLFPLAVHWHILKRFNTEHAQNGNNNNNWNERSVSFLLHVSDVNARNFFARCLAVSTVYACLPCMCGVTGMIHI